MAWQLSGIYADDTKHSVGIQKQGALVDDAVTSRPRPFLKWAGGKRQLLPQIRARLQLGGVYHEPFVGGGALFFDVLPKWAALSDRNERLVRTYAAIRDDVEAVIELLGTYPNDPGFFYKMRERLPHTDLGTDVEVAASLIFLNRTCYNGLYRVNRSGGFNVPYGRYANPKICDSANLRACSLALQDVSLTCAPFEVALQRATEGDFVYCDPPYASITTKESFGAYTPEPFGPEAQLRLRDTALELKEKGVCVLISSSDSPEILDLYREGFSVRRVTANRSVGAQAASRGRVVELLIANYDVHAPTLRVPPAG